MSAQSAIMANRIAKADRIVTKLLAELEKAGGFPILIDNSLASTVEAFNEEHWEVVAKHLGEDPPSADTQTLIVSDLRRREKKFDHPENPLEGLPKL